MEGLEITCFQIISNVGTARSSYIEAIHKAKERDFDGARACVEAGQQEFLKGHEAHFELLQREAKGGPAGSSLILIHAEDQLMSAETFKILLHEFLDICRRFDELERRICS